MPYMSKIRCSIFICRVSSVEVIDVSSHGSALGCHQFPVPIKRWQLRFGRLNVTSVFQLSKEKTNALLVLKVSVEIK